MENFLRKTLMYLLYVKGRCEPNRVRSPLFWFCLQARKLGPRRLFPGHACTTKWFLKGPELLLQVGGECMEGWQYFLGKMRMRQPQAVKGQA